MLIVDGFPIVSVMHLQTGSPATATTITITGYHSFQQLRSTIEKDAFSMATRTSIFTAIGYECELLENGSAALPISQVL